MPFRGFEGPAGTGKTHRLLDVVRERILQQPLEPYQRVLALTFMHGSRKRLHERFSADPGLRRVAVCQTLDSFAQHLVHRWRAHLNALPAADDFDRTCDLAGQLLERPEICAWVAARFPIVVIDEAQELDPTRLRIVAALERYVDLFVAADEFQCLNDGIDTGPFQAWFERDGVERLVQVRRTNRQGLLDAGVALRAGTPPARQAPGLRIDYKFRNVMPFAIGSALRGPDEVALIYAPAAQGWADEIRTRAAQPMRSARYDIPALRITPEAHARDEVENALGLICPDDRASADEVLQRIAALAEPPSWAKLVHFAVGAARRAHGRGEWQREDLRTLFERKASVHRAHGYTPAIGIPMMSIHGAKNRQFRRVVVLWGPGVPGAADYQRRLLYNAITRAQISCTVFVRTEATLRAAPFS